MGALMAARRERFERWVADEGAALEELAQRMGDGEFLPAICAGMDIPQSRVMAWLMGDVRRWEVYQRALRVQADLDVAATVAIADTLRVTREGEEVQVDVPQAKLMIETRFKRAGFYDPERFSPKAGADVGAMAEGITEALQRISERKRAEMLARQVEQIEQGQVVSEQ